MIVHIPSPLLSYTGQVTPVEAEGATLRALLADLERRYPGFRFRVLDEQDRIREHIRFFRDTTPERDLDAPLGASREVHLICALSGG